MLTFNLVLKKKTKQNKTQKFIFKVFFCNFNNFIFYFD